MDPVTASYVKLGILLWVVVAVVVFLVSAVRDGMGRHGHEDRDVVGVVITSIAWPFLSIAYGTIGLYELITRTVWRVRSARRPE